MKEVSFFLFFLIVGCTFGTSNSQIILSVNDTKYSCYSFSPDENYLQTVIFTNSSIQVQSVEFYLKSSSPAPNISLSISPLDNHFYGKLLENRLIFSTANLTFEKNKEYTLVLSCSNCMEPELILAGSLSGSSAESNLDTQRTRTCIFISNHNPYSFGKFTHPYIGNLDADILMSFRGRYE